MPQNPIGLQLAALNPRPTQLPDGGGMKTTTLTAAAALKVGKGRICRIVVLNMGTTSGGFTLNDCAATGDASAANLICTIPYTAVGWLNKVVPISFLCTTGITLSAVPGAGSPSIKISYI
jgi:hypothetical protein